MIYSMKYICLRIVIVATFFKQSLCDIYRKSQLVGTNHFMVIGDSSITLYDENGALQNTLAESLAYPIKSSSTTFPLNHSLVIDANKEMTFIDWKGTSPYSINQTVSLDSESNFQAVDCLDGSTLCFAYSQSSKVVRFDVRELYSSFLTTATSEAVASSINQLKMSDVNLKYLFASSTTHLYLIDPISLTELLNFDYYVLESLEIRFIESIESNPVVILLDENLQISTFTFPTGAVFLKSGSITINAISSVQGVKLIDKTRYVSVFGTGNDIVIFWVTLSNTIQTSYKHLVNLPGALNTISLSIFRKKYETFTFFYTETNASDSVKVIEKKFSEINFIKDPQNLSPVHPTCSHITNYSKDTCYGCLNGEILGYTLSPTVISSTVCLNMGVDSGQIHNDRRPNSADLRCSMGGTYCTTCFFEYQCSSCFGDLQLSSLVFLNICRNYCNLGFSPNGSGLCTACAPGCASCETDMLACKTCSIISPFIEGGECRQNCLPGQYRSIEGNENHCREDTRLVKEDCPLGGLRNNTGGCQTFTTGYVVRQGNLIKSCPYGEKEISWTCSICPLGTFSFSNGTCSNDCDEDGLEVIGRGCADICSSAQLSQNYRCVTSCDTDYFLEDGYCKPLFCNKLTHVRDGDSCLTACTGTKIKNTVGLCIQCGVGEVIQNSNCAPGCNSDFYLSDGICLECNPDCKTCSGGLETQCDSCDLPKIFHQNSCVDECPLPFTDILDAWVECVAPNVISLGVCTTQCASGEVQGGVVCIPCSTPNRIQDQSCVAECTLPYLPANTTHCKLCPNTKAIFQDSCIDSCPQNTQKNANNISIECTSSEVFSNGVCLPCPTSCNPCIVNSQTGNTECQVASPSQNTTSSSSSSQSSFFLKSKNFDSESKTVTLTFDSILLSSNIENLTFSIDKEIMEVKDIQIKDKYKILASLKMEQTEINKKELFIDMEGADSATLISEESPPKTYSEFPIKIKVDYYVSFLNDILKSARTIIPPIIISAIMISFVSDPITTMKMSKFFTSLKYLGLVNILLPKIVRDFTKNLDVSRYNIFSFILDTEENQCECNLKTKIRQNNFSCVGLNNTSVEVCILFFLIFLKFMIWVLQKITQYLTSDHKKGGGTTSDVENPAQEQQATKMKNRNVLSSMLDHLDKFINFSLIIPLANSMGLKLFVSNWISVLNTPKLSFYLVISFGVFSLIIFYNLIFFFLTLYFYYYHYSLNSSKNKPKINQVGQSSVESARLESDQKELQIDKGGNNTLLVIYNRICNLQRSRNVFYTLFTTVKDLVMSLVLVGGQNFPSFQLFILIILYSSQSALIIYLRPLKTAKSNLLEFNNSFGYTLILFIFCIIYFLQNSLSKKELSTYLGIPILLVLVVLILLNIIINTIESIYFIISKVSEYFSKKKNSKEKLETQKMNVDMDSSLNVLNESKADKMSIRISREDITKINDMSSGRRNSNLEQFELRQEEKKPSLIRNSGRSCMKMGPAEKEDFSNSIKRSIVGLQESCDEGSKIQEQGDKEGVLYI